MPLLPRKCSRTAWVTDAVSAAEAGVPEGEGGAASEGAAVDAGEAGETGTDWPLLLQPTIARAPSAKSAIERRVILKMIL